MKLNKVLKTLLGVIALGLFSVGAQAASGAGPYYATPSWDQTLQCDTAATCPRFIILTSMGDGAVLDRETGLVWARSPSSTSTFSWNDAQSHCIHFTVGARQGWRLPTLQELASLVDASVPAPGLALPAGHPFTGVDSTVIYWSATAYAPNAIAAWGVIFGNSGGENFFSKDDTRSVWCVRGGQGPDAQ